MRPGALRSLDGLAGVLLCVLSLGAAAVAQSDPLTPISSGCEVDYPPFCIVHEDGTADGFSVELMAAAARAMGRDVTFRTGPWEDVRGWLERGEIEALPLVGRTPERESIFDFTVPYLVMHGAIVVRSETHDVRTLNDLRGRVVAVMAGDNTEEFLRREERGFQIVTTPTFAEALRLLTRRGCDAVVIQQLVAIRLIDELDLSSQLRIVEPPILEFSQDFCFAVRQGNADLLAVLNEGLALVIADGTYRRLYAKWFAHLELPPNRAILIGGDFDYPPFEYLNADGQPAGYNIDLVRAVAQAVGLDIQIRLGPWAEMVQALEDGEVDALAGMYYSPERDQRFDFSQAHIVNHCVAVMRAGEGPPPSSAEALKGRRIVVEAGDIMERYALDHGLSDSLVTVETQAEALQAVAAGDFDCALVARSTALDWIRRTEMRDLVVGRTPLLALEYCFAVAEGSAALLAELSEGLTVLEQSGEYRHIYETWMGIYDPGIVARRWLKLVLIAASSLLLFVALALFWAQSLRRQVRARTKELRESAELQRALLSCSPVALFSTDMEDRVLTWNASAQRVFGWAEGDVVGKPLPILPDGSHDEVAALRRQALQEGGFAGREIPGRRRDGQPLDIRLSAAPVRDAGGDAVAIMAAAEDITARKRAAARIEHLNRVLRAIRDVNQLITHATDRQALLSRSCEILISTRGYRSAWIGVQDPQGKLLAYAESGIGAEFSKVKAALERGECPACCHAAMESVSGVSVIHNTDTNCVSCPLSRLYRDTAALAGALRLGERQYGVLVVALPKGLADDPEEQSLFKELVGDVAYALHSLKLEEERTRHEQSMRESEEKYRQVVEHSTESICIIQDDVVRFANASTLRLLESSAPTLAARRFHEFIHPADLPTVAERFRRRLAGEAFETGNEFRVVSERGTVRWVKGYASRIEWEARPAILCIVADITRQRQEEEFQREREAHLRQTQRLESIGTLASGVAHEINNPLTGVLNYAELIKTRAGDDERVAEFAQGILAEGNRIAEIVRNLLTYARHGDGTGSVVGISEIVNASLSLLRSSLIRSQIELAVNIPVDAPMVKCRKQQVQQVLVNLITNAQAALDERYPRGDPNKQLTLAVEVLEDAEGRWLRTTVADHGVGIPEAIRDRIFDPFFTSRGRDQGTGLGLWVSRGIAAEHDGRLLFETQVGKFTRFFFDLPLDATSE
ncbi:MAG: transporter substrate-binding domain-containing protein [Candidatus Bipolaricaulota bacterium]